MKLNLAKLQVLAPEYMAASPDRKKELLKEYGITRPTFYNALKRYNMVITTVKTLA
ncbi:hypothetical protein ACR3BZ_000024 [Enterobacter hormaechei]|uniref:hypothetical protein n=1 Tax=Enterobacter cloacae complex TaxID=354276 RepID=UPI001253957F|nr:MULTISPECIES: hypothetical protein [Enterobacter cloacae complex]VAC85698.1 Uncharacterised protein [Enterobacter cloacae]MBK4612291.1 hypothetical protein [Enterobacter hormaechei]MBK4641332.1 hypothetical protein [Enterobacter hormaechei]MCF2345577.1 hypothetical protein [Enterobacter hormaechei]MCF2372735.1 hypothetical protein [Enterobacter hormaechei]